MTVGRKTKLTKELLKKLERNLGNYPASYACPLSGISTRTFYTWKNAAVKLSEELESGELDDADLSADDEMLIQFLHTIETARAKLEMQFFDTWKRAAKRWKDEQTGKMKNGNWMAAKEMLAKLNPREFGNLPPQLIQELLSGGESSEHDDDSGVIETPAFSSESDPVSAFLNASVAQQKNTSQTAKAKQGEQK